MLVRTMEASSLLLDIGLCHLIPIMRLVVHALVLLHLGVARCIVALVDQLLIFGSYLLIFGVQTEGAMTLCVDLDGPLATCDQHGVDIIPVV